LIVDLKINRMSWLYFALLAGGSFGFYNLFMRFTSSKFAASIGLMFVAGTSFLVATITTIVLKASGQSLQFDKSAIWFPIAAGIFTGIAEIFYLLMFSKNQSLAIGAPLVIGLTSVVAAVIGWAFLREHITALQALGIVLSIAGITILSWKA
jgi:drug/metabolite transporter (DMT)-like permease